MGRRQTFGEEREEFIQRSKRDWVATGRRFMPRHPVSPDLSSERFWKFAPRAALWLTLAVVLMVGLPLLYFTLLES